MTILIRVLLAVGGLAAAVGGWAAIAQARRLATWEPAPAVILESEVAFVRSRTGSNPSAVPRIRYRYDVDGVLHESGRIYPGPFASTSGEAHRLTARFPARAATTAFVDPVDPTRAFLVPQVSVLPHLLVLLVAAPTFSLAAGLALGAVRFVRSGEREDPPPRKDAQGWHWAAAFRPYGPLRNATAATFAIFTTVGLVAFVDYFGHAREPDGMAVLLCLGWLLLVIRLGWAVVTRSLVAPRMHDARLAVRPAYPKAGQTLHVRFEQEMRAEVSVRAVDLTLVGERLTFRRRAGRTRSKRKRIARVRLRLPARLVCRPGAPLRVEGSWTVPSDATPQDGFVRWWVEARTRVFGPDYVTLFPLGAPSGNDEPEDDVQHARA